MCIYLSVYLCVRCYVMETVWQVNGVWAAGVGSMCVQRVNDPGRVQGWEARRGIRGEAQRPMVRGQGSRGSPGPGPGSTGGLVEVWCSREITGRTHRQPDSHCAILYRSVKKLGIPSSMEFHLHFTEQLCTAELNSNIKFTRMLRLEK